MLSPSPENKQNTKSYSSVNKQNMLSPSPINKQNMTSYSSVNKQNKKHVEFFTCE